MCNSCDDSWWHKITFDMLYKIKKNVLDENQNILGNFILWTKEEAESNEPSEELWNTIEYAESKPHRNEIWINIGY